MAALSSDGNRRGYARDNVAKGVKVAASRPPVIEGALRLPSDEAAADVDEEEPPALAFTPPCSVDGYVRPGRYSIGGTFAATLAA